MGEPNRAAIGPGLLPGLLVAVGGRDGTSWNVQLMGCGQVLATLNPDQARRLARDIAALADICEREFAHDEN